MYKEEYGFLPYDKKKNGYSCLSYDKEHQIFFCNFYNYPAKTVRICLEAAFRMTWLSKKKVSRIWHAWQIHRPIEVL